MIWREILNERSELKIWMDERMDGCMEGEMDECMDGRMVGWVEGMMDKWMDGWKDSRLNTVRSISFLPTLISFDFRYRWCPCGAQRAVPFACSSNSVKRDVQFPRCYLWWRPVKFGGRKRVGDGLTWHWRESFFVGKGVCFPEWILKFNDLLW